jgi:hypothetical protein
MKDLGIKKIQIGQGSDQYKYFGILGLMDRIFYPGWKTNFGFALVSTLCVYLVILRERFKDGYALAVVIFFILYYFLTKISGNLRKK